MERRANEKLGEGSFKPPIMPDTLQAYISTHDPCHNPDSFKGKSILVLSGAKDTLVPWSASKEFVEKLDVVGGVKEVLVQEDAGHECTNVMQERIAKFIWERALSAAHGGQSRL